MRNVVFLLMIGLVVYTVIDVTRSEKDERLGLHRAIWIAAILLFPELGSIIWIAVSRTVRARSQGTVPAGGHKLAPAPLAPDDDPEFLWRLEQRQRQAERDAKHPDRDDDQDHPSPRDSTS